MCKKKMDESAQCIYITHCLDIGWSMKLRFNGTSQIKIKLLT